MGVGVTRGFRAGHPWAVVDDFMLPNRSPCVDAGLNQPWMEGARDVIGQPRIYRKIVDMGALENNAARGAIMIMR